MSTIPMTTSGLPVVRCQTSGIRSTYCDQDWRQYGSFGSSAACAAGTTQQAGE